MQKSIKLLRKTTFNWELKWYLRAANAPVAIIRFTIDTSQANALYASTHTYDVHFKWAISEGVVFVENSNKLRDVWTCVQIQICIFWQFIENYLETWQ